MSVYTVGNEKNYDRGIIEHGEQFQKMGRNGEYPGGYAFESVEDAMRIIDELGKGNEWAVYRLDANWEKDTVPSENGWWHALVNSSLIIEKVELVNHTA